MSGKHPPDAAALYRAYDRLQILRISQKISLLVSVTHLDYILYYISYDTVTDMGAISIRIPEEIDTRLTEEARLEGLPRSEVVREAIADYLTRRERERFMEEMVAAARALAADPAASAETRELVAESVATSNEALDIAEGRKPGEPWPEEQGEKWWR